MERVRLCAAAWSRGLVLARLLPLSQSGLGQLTGARCAVWVSVSLDGPRMRGCVGHTWVRFYNSHIGCDCAMPHYHCTCVISTGTSE